MYHERITFIIFGLAGAFRRCTVPAANFSVSDYTEIVSLVDSTEPPLTMALSEDELRDLNPS